MIGLSILEKRLFRILIAILIGFVFAGVAFLMQRTAEPLSIGHINQANIKYESKSDVLSLYNGINQVNITAYSGISGVPSKATKITIIAVPSGGDPYSGYTLSGYRYSYSDITQLLGDDQEYRQAGITGNCYVSQLPQGLYFIAILTEAPDGNLAYHVTNYRFENGFYEDALNLLFFLIALGVYSLIAYACLELLYRGRNVPPGTPLPASGDVPKRHSLLSILNIIFLALSFWIFLNVTFSNISEFANLETYKTFITILASLLVFIVMCSAWFGINFSKKPSSKTKLWIVLGVIGFFALQLGICFSNTGLIPSFDSSEITKSALSYWQKGVVTYNATYFVVFPNNYFMLFTDIGLMKLAAGSMVVYTQLTYLFNIILIDISLILAFLCIKELFGRRTAVVMLLPLCLVIGLNPIMIMFYTDTLSMVFPVLVFFLYLKLRKTKKIPFKIMLLIAIALSIYLGYQYKMTTVILPVSIALVELIVHIREWKRLLAAAVACVLVFGIVFALNKKTEELTYHPSFLYLNFNVDSDLKAFPFTYFVMLGLHYPYGAIDLNDWKFAITRPIVSREADIGRVIQDRVQQYGPGYITFLSNKLNFAFGQSTFSIGTRDYYYNMPDSTISKLSQDVFGSSGKWFPVFAYTLQGMWVLCLFLIAIPLFFKRKKKVDRNISILRIALSGMIVYLLVSENNPRQLVNQLPLILILASYSLPPVMDGVKKLTSKALAKLKSIN